MEAKGADGGASIAEVNEGGDTGGNGGTNAANSGLAEGGLAAGAAGAKSRRPSSVAGMSKDFNGDKIGVAQDSLFEMLHRRYRVHNDANSFLPNGTATPRSP